MRTSAMALLRQVLLFLPLVVLLPTVFAVPVQGVFYAQMFTDLVVLLIGVILLCKTFANIRRLPIYDKQGASVPA